jgi:hypothetical protein
VDPAGPSTREILEAVDVAWQPFHVAAMRLAPDRLEEATAAGWTYKVMLAHVAAWHELTARRLEAYREKGRVEPPTGRAALPTFEELGFARTDIEALMREWHFDKFNAAVKAAATERAGADVLRSLDASFAHVREAIAALTDAESAAHVTDGKSFVYAIVEGNTFAHYDEHAVELGLTPRGPETRPAS